MLKELEKKINEKKVVLKAAREMVIRMDYELDILYHQLHKAYKQKGEE